MLTSIRLLAPLALGLLAVVTPARATIDAPGDLAAYVVLGVDEVELRDNAVVSGGHVGVNEENGTLDFRRFISMGDGSALVAHRPSIGAGSSPFDLFANDLSRIDPSVAVRGLTLPFPPPILTLPALPAFAPGTDPVTVERDATVILGPGAYGDVFVNRRGTLILTGGSYELASLRTNKLSKVFVEAPATINVAGRMSIGHLAGLGPSVEGVGADDVAVNVGGTFVRIGPATHVVADLFAPLARVRLGRSFHGRGRFVAREVLGDGTLILQRGAAAGGVTETAGGGRAAPPGTFCTLTQATYGAAGGDANGAGGLVTLNPDVLPISVGMPGVTSLTVADQASLVCFLPAIGLDAALCAGLDGCGGDMTIDACSNPPILDFDGAGDGSSAGQGAGTLLGELLAAKLSVALSAAGATPAGLGGLLLPARLCTDRCPDGRDLDPSKMEFQSGAVGISDGINTLADLLAIADQALGTPCAGRTCATTRQAAFAPPNPIARSSVTHALAVINECFAGCASIVPCP